MSTKKLYVGNLPWAVGDKRLHDIFAEHGEVTEAKVITDRETGRSRGFGFVTVNESDSEEMIRALNMKEIDGRELKVNMAKTQDDPRKRRKRRRRHDGDRR